MLRKNFMFFFILISSLNTSFAQKKEINFLEEFNKKWDDTTKQVTCLFNDRALLAMAEWDEEEFKILKENTPKIERETLLKIFSDNKKYSDQIISGSQYKTLDDLSDHFHYRYLLKNAIDQESITLPSGNIFLNKKSPLSIISATHYQKVLCFPSTKLQKDYGIALE